MAGADIVVRSTWHAVAIPGHASPYDVAHLKLYYPATAGVDEDARQSGELAPDHAGAPLPVVVFAGGVNVSQEAYRWLAIELVRDGFAVVMYDHVGQLPGYVGKTPGLDLGAVGPDTYGTRPTCDALAPILDLLGELNSVGEFAGLLDLDRIAFGGHSAGGTVVLQSARRSYFPGLRAVFSYAGHTVASSMLRAYEPGTVLQCGDGKVDLLLMSGEEDGVFHASADKYGPHGADPVRATFEHGIPDGDGSTWLVSFKGANHFAIGTHEDPTAARGFLDGVAGMPVESTRETLGMVISAFLRASLRSDAAARTQLDDLEVATPPTISLISHR